DESRQRLLDWVNANGKSCSAFDFTTKGILQEAVKKAQYSRLRDPKGKAPGLLGWIPTRAVTFIDNHDTGSTQQHWPFPNTQQHWPFPKGKVAVGYAYILTHPGVPCLFWDHLFDWGDALSSEIKKLLAVRQRNGITAGEALTILCAEDDMYVARIGERRLVVTAPHK
ncbi:hypothetical protein FOA52_005861, partial [Chlamydomonas sp. UWO 241]